MSFSASAQTHSFAERRFTDLSIEHYNTDPHDSQRQLRACIVYDEDVNVCFDAQTCPKTIKNAVSTSIFSLVYIANREK